MYPGLQRSYVVKDVRKRLNSKVEIVRVESGAYRPFKKTLSAFLTHVVCSFACVVSYSFNFLWYNNNCDNENFIRQMLIGII